MRSGFGHGDTVGFIPTNRPEFHLLDTAAMRLGAAPFSIYNTSSEEQIAYALRDAACQVVNVEAAFAPRLAAAAAQTGTVRHTILIDGEDDDALGLDALEADDEAQTHADRGQVCGRDQRPYTRRDLTRGRGPLLGLTAMASRLDLRLLLLPLRGE